MRRPRQVTVFPECPKCGPQVVIHSAVFGTRSEAESEQTYASYKPSGIHSSRAAWEVPKFPAAPTAAPLKPVRWRVALRGRPGPVAEVTARMAFDAWRAAAPELGHPTFAEVWCWLAE